MSNLAIANILSLSPSVPVSAKTIHRAEHNANNPFTVISNKLLRDTSIRHSDRGLLAQLLSWKDNHFLCIKALVKSSVEGRDAIRGMIDRLMDAGYIRARQTKSADGKFSHTVYEIFEESVGTVATLDMNGVIDDEDPSHMQLDLFESENNEPVKNKECQKMKNVSQSADGKSVNGKPETNKYYSEINTLSNNKAPAGFSGKQEDQESKVETKESLLKKWQLDFNDGMLKAKLGIAGLLTFIDSQDKLNTFLIDFNQQHEKYKHLNHTQRLHNFVAYLVRVKHTPVEYRKHLARMKALGFDVHMPVPQKKTNAKQAERIARHVDPAYVNPFPVQQQTAPVVPGALIDEDF